MKTDKNKYENGREREWVPDPAKNKNPSKWHVSFPAWFLYLSLFSTSMFGKKNVHLDGVHHCICHIDNEIYFLFYFFHFFRMTISNQIKKGYLICWFFLSLFLSFSHFFPLLLLAKSTSELFFLFVIRITNLILFFSFIFFFHFCDGSDTYLILGHKMYWCLFMHVSACGALCDLLSFFCFVDCCRFQHRLHVWSHFYFNIWQVDIIQPVATTLWRYTHNLIAGDA